MPVFDYIIVTALALGLSMFCAFIANRQFSTPVFLASMAICISILVWIPLLPTWMIVISILMIVAMLFTEKNDEHE